jgi:hypothetical protein
VEEMQRPEYRWLLRFTVILGGYTTAINLVNSAYFPAITALAITLAALLLLAGTQKRTKTIITIQQTNGNERKTLVGELPAYASLTLPATESPIATIQALTPAGETLHGTLQKIDHIEATNTHPESNTYHYTFPQIGNQK